MSKNLSYLIHEYIKELRSKRRWKILFKTCFLIIIIFVIVYLITYFNKNKTYNHKHIGLIKINGIIDYDNVNSSNKVNQSLTTAFSNNNVQAVIIEINSPGGSPVQSDNIYRHLKNLRKKYPKIPTYAVCQDTCASGGYYIAASAQFIYANEMTITGSIGVKAAGFGFTELIKKIGIERRLYSLGINKSFLDSFEPEKENQIKEMNILLSQMQKKFITIVKESRKNSLVLKYENNVFSGIPISGINAKKYGLIDGFLTIENIKDDIFSGIPLINYTKPVPWFEKFNNKLFNTMYCYLKKINNVSLL